MGNNNNGSILKIYRGVTIIVIAAGIFSLFNMNMKITKMDVRMDEYVKYIEYRLSRIETHHGKVELDEQW